MEKEIVVSVLALSLVPLIIILVEIAKVFRLPSRLYPVLSVLLGIAGALLVVSNNIWEALGMGIMLGVLASGIWSVVKHIFKRRQKNPA